jgi:hypothetical protein
MLINPWRHKHAAGSPKYIRRLTELQRMHKGDTGIAKALKEARKMGGGGFAGAGAIKYALGGAFVTSAIFATLGAMEAGAGQEGVEAARGATIGIADFIGWEVGSKAGMGIGAAIGSAIPIVGTAIGAGVGYLAGGMAGAIAGGSMTEALTRIPDRLVEREQSKRRLNWGVQSPAFNTQRAHTMRQQSLSMMNRGTMSARSLLGREAMFVHR